MSNDDTQAEQLHQYIHTVLQTGEHGPHRHILVDKSTLNDAIDKHKKDIAKLIKPDVMGKSPAPGDETKVTIKNDLGNVSFQCIPEAPSTLAELTALMARARRENLTIKPAGSMHAFSPACVTSGFLIRSKNLAGITRTTLPLRDASQAEGLYDVLGGTTLEAIIEALEKDGRALMNLGGFKGQGIAGATATGTHGSGLSLPPLASMIQSIVLVSPQFTENGNPTLYRIEPTQGLTNPSKHDPSLILIQDDTVFNAVVTGLGAFGVIYSVTISTVPFYYIKETREKMTWDQAKSVLRQGPGGDILKYHNSEVWINQYTGDVLVTKRELVDAPPADPTGTPNMSWFAKVVQEVPAFRALARDIHDSPLIPDLSEETGATLAAFLKAFPLIVPAIINIAMDTQAHSEPKTAKYYDIYDIGFADNFPAISTEISYPLDTYIDATDAAISSLQSAHKKNIHEALAGFLSLRFTAPTSAAVSMSYAVDHETTSGRCYLELFGLWRFFTGIGMYETLVGPITLDSIQRFKGRPHWGQYLTPRFTSTLYKSGDPAFFASIEAFRSVAERFDPGHMMANEFLVQMVGLDEGGREGDSSSPAGGKGKKWSLLDLFRCPIF